MRLGILYIELKFDEYKLMLKVNLGIWTNQGRGKTHKLTKLYVWKTFGFLS